MTLGSATRLVAVSLLIVASAGCAVGPRYQKPSLNTPSAWSQAAPGVDPSAPAGGAWWKQFHDPQLDRLVERAVKNNHDLRVAQARIREARAARGITASAGLPQVSLAASYDRQQRSNAVPPFRDASGDGGLGSVFGNREQNLYQTGFDATWELDIFGGVRRDKEAASADVEAAVEQQRDVLLSLLAEVARNYVELRGLQRQSAIVGENLETQRENLRLLEVRFQAGLATALDVDRAQAQVDSTQAALPPLERAVKQAAFRLSVLAGEPPATLLADLLPEQAAPSLPAQVPAGLPSDLLRRRPDVRRAARELAAATARIGVAKADFFPRFSLTGAFGRRSEQFADLGPGLSQFWSVGPGLRLPIFTAGRIRNNLRVQTARQEQALARYEQAVLTSLEDVENALVAYSREQARRESLARAAQANRRAVDLAMARYTGGLEDFLSVLDAQRSRLQSEEQLVESERALSVNVIALYKALGGGWEAF